jgi:hypothetical protein
VTYVATAPTPNIATAAVAIFFKFTRFVGVEIFTTHHHQFFNVINH